jgi:choline dehydrogenase-like flavoprotein
MIRRITDEHRRSIFSARDLGEPSLRDDVLGREYDVCIIGSGPGGSVAAATLAQAGAKVILVERGAFRPPDDFTFQVLDMSGRLGHLELTKGYRTALLQGDVLGGSSIIFGAVAMRPQPHVFDEWKAKTAVGSIDAATLEPHYAHVGEMLSVTRQDPRRENRSNAIVREMASALDCPDGLEVVQRYTRGCAGMGLCNFGCGFDFKGTMLNSFLPLALERGLTVITECTAESLEGRMQNGAYHATGLQATLSDAAGALPRRRVTIKARSFVLAAGAYFSSTLLLRSRDLPNRDAIGAKIYLQPHAQVFALFDEPVTSRGRVEGDRYLPDNGVPAIYNFTGLLREHRFFWLASILFPANLAAFVSHLPPAEHRDVMRRYHCTTSITLTIRDDPARSRVLFRDGRPQLDFQESRGDLEAVRQAFLHAARGLLAVGARRVFLPMLAPPVITRPADLAAVEKMRFDYSDLLVYSDHTSGGIPYGATPRTGAADATGRVFGTANVRVSDSSLFPNALGVNPSWTIMALARHVASQHAAELS